MSVKINSLEIENVKRVKAVRIVPNPNGLTIIGGDNNQGKTSVLDALAWALGGNKFKPSQAERAGSMSNPSLKVTLSNGLMVERKGKSSTLKVIDPSGNRGGQSLLDSFVEELAIDLPKFMESSSKSKADTLLNIIGVGEVLFKLESDEKRLYNERHAVGRNLDRKQKYADELEGYTGVPEVPIDVMTLIQRQQSIFAKNGENQRLRQNLATIQMAHATISKEVELLQFQLNEALNKQQQLSHDLLTAQKTTQDLQDESTEEIEKELQNIEEINRRVRSNLDKERAYSDAEQERENYAKLTSEIEAIREQKLNLLNNADLPLEGLSVADGELIYQGQKWDNMSGSQQLKVSTAIVRRLKPDCGFVLLDKLEQMDKPTLQEFGEWLEQEGLQAIATRVSTGDECSIIIEDGYSIEKTLPNKPVVTGMTKPIVSNPWA